MIYEQGLMHLNDGDFQVRYLHIIPNYLIYIADLSFTIYMV